tara:strand:- start:3 stop:302 length:300 start_codon:yes stop_codon:yes gene_type:complete
MFNASIHNVTEFKTSRVKDQGYDNGGWIVLNVIAENNSWGDRDQDQITSVVTFFMKDMELGLAQLQDSIAKGIAKYRREVVEEEQKKEKELKEEKSNNG